MYTDFSTLPYPVSFYNNSIMFPEGSVLHQFGNIKILNNKDANNPINPTIIDSVVTDEFYLNSAIFFRGKLIFDVGNLPTHCRKITFKANTDTIFVDSYVYDISAGTPLPIQIGDSARIEDPGDGSGTIVIGKFNTLAFQSNQLTSPQSHVHDFLIEACSNAEFCNANFEYNVIGNEVEISNSSSILADESESFSWSINSIDLPGDYDNVIYEHENQSKFEVCLGFSKASCVNGSSFSKCDSVQIESYREELDNSDHFTLSPNNDGIQDYIDLLAGTKIFDRNGYLITELLNDSQWSGTNQGEIPLPTGLYTVMYNDSKFNITIVR